jgi:hypothetical protein
MANRGTFVNTTQILALLERQWEEAREALVDTFLALPESRYWLSVNGLGLVQKQLRTLTTELRRRTAWFDYVVPGGAYSAPMQV